MAGASRNTTYMKIFMVLFGMVTMYVIVSEIHFERECARFCNKDETPECYLRRSAVLIYDPDVASHEMSFIQNAHPRINVADYAAEVATGRYFDINCPVDHYWPRVSTLSRHNSCAVVGNSGVLVDSNCGPVIDAHDYVIRANLAPVRGYSVDVGERVHMTILNFETLFFLYTNLTTKPKTDRWHRAYVDRVRYLNDSILWYSKSTVQRNSSAFLQGAVRVLKDYYKFPIQIAYSWRPVSIEKLYGLKHYATTGFNAYVIAKTFCNHVTLYGFYPSQEGESGFHVRHHYYEDVVYDYINAVHNLRSEMRKLRELEEKGEVTIVTDVCPGGERKRVWSRPVINRDAMVDPRFAFRLDNDRLKEIFNIADSEKNDDAGGDGGGGGGGGGNEKADGEASREKKQYETKDEILTEQVVAPPADASGQNYVDDIIADKVTAADAENKLQSDRFKDFLLSGRSFNPQTLGGESAAENTGDVTNVDHDHAETIVGDADDARVETENIPGNTDTENNLPNGSEDVFQKLMAN